MGEWVWEFEYENHFVKVLNVNGSNKSPSKVSRPSSSSY